MTLHMSVCAEAAVSRWSGTAVPRTRPQCTFTCKQSTLANMHVMNGELTSSLAGDPHIFEPNHHPYTQPSITVEGSGQRHPFTPST